MTKEEREELGKNGRAHVLKNYNMEDFAKKWDESFTDAVENYGSWDTRKNHQAWTLTEV